MKIILFFYLIICFHLFAYINNYKVLKELKIDKNNLNLTLKKINNTFFIKANFTNEIILFNKNNKYKVFKDFIPTSEVKLPIQFELISQKIKFLKKIGRAGNESGQFNEPTFLAKDLINRILICDSGNDRIQIFSRNGIFLDQFGKFGINDEWDFVNDNGINDKNQIAYFNYPCGIAVGTEIFIADRDNNRIAKFDRFGNFLISIGSFGSSNNGLDAPIDIEFDSQKNLYVVDSGNNRIKKYDSGGYLILKFGYFGKASGQFRNPKALTIDSNNDIYVLDSGNNRIQKFNKDGIFLKKKELDKSTIKYVNDLANIGNFIIFISKSDLYILDSDLNIVLKKRLKNLNQGYGILPFEDLLVISDIEKNTILTYTFSWQVYKIEEQTK